MPKIHLKNKKVRRIVMAAVAVVVIAGGSLGIVLAATSKSTTSTTTFKATQASTGTISNYISASGTAQNSSEFSLTAANAGTVDSVSVSQGDTVTKGQVLAHINDTTSTANLLTKQKALTSAQSDLSSAKESLNNLYTTAIAAGRIKSVKVEAGDDASAIGSAYGYLMMLSISGETQVSISNPQVTVASGDAVNVTVGSSTYSGTVSSASASGNTGGSSGGVTILVSSDVPAVGATATVTKNGSTVGTGTIALTSDAIKISASGSSGGSSGNSSSKIAAVYVTEGQSVSKGAKLLKYDDTSVQKSITQAQQEVDQAQSDLNNAQTAVDKDTIVSPIDGVVAELDVKSGDNVQNGGSIATVLDPNQMQTTLSVDETDISSVKVGQSVNVTLDAISGKTFTGTVTKVSTLGTTSNNVTTYSVVVTIASPTGINVGMTTNAKIITESKENAVVVPASAVLEVSGTTGYVIKSSSISGITKLANMTTAELVQRYGTKVSIGLSNSDKVEITSGVSNGETMEIPVTVNLSAAKSLTKSNSSSSNAMGGMGGNMGGDMGGNMGGGPTGGNTQQRTGGTGNTVG